MRATSNWRVTVIWLAAICVANVVSIVSGEQRVGGLSAAIVFMSSAAATALVVSLFVPVRRFTLFVAAVSLLLQAIDIAISAPSIVVAAWVAAAGAALIAWMVSMRYAWPDLRHIYRVALI